MSLLSPKTANRGGKRRTWFVLALLASIFFIFGWINASGHGESEHEGYGKVTLHSKKLSRKVQKMTKITIRTILLRGSTKQHSPPKIDPTGKLNPNAPTMGPRTPSFRTPGSWLWASDERPQREEEAVEVKIENNTTVWMDCTILKRIQDLRNLHCKRLNEQEVWKREAVRLGVLPDLPTYTCLDEERVGQLLAGGKWVCGARRLPAGCVVYSVGNAEHNDFERTLAALAPHCEVHIFKSKDEDDNNTLNTSSNFYLHEWKIVGLNGGNESNEHNLIDVSSMLGHPRIDILKIDMRGEELDALKGVFTSGALPSVGQIQLNVHGVVKPLPEKVVDLIGSILGAGFEIFHAEENLFLNSNVEYAFINTSNIPREMREGCEQVNGTSKWRINYKKPYPLFSSKCWQANAEVTNGNAVELSVEMSRTLDVLPDVTCSRDAFHHTARVAAYQKGSWFDFQAEEMIAKFPLAFWAETPAYTCPDEERFGSLLTSGWVCGVDRLLPRGEDLRTYEATEENEDQMEAILDHSCVVYSFTHGHSAGNEFFILSHNISDHNTIETLIPFEASLASRASFCTVHLFTDGGFHSLIAPFIPTSGKPRGLQANFVLHKAFLSVEGATVPEYVQHLGHERVDILRIDTPAAFRAMPDVLLVRSDGHTAEERWGDDRFLPRQIIVRFYPDDAKMGNVLKHVQRVMNTMVERYVVFHVEVPHAVPQVIEVSFLLRSLMKSPLHWRDGDEEGREEGPVWGKRYGCGRGKAMVPTESDLLTTDVPSM